MRIRIVVAAVVLLAGTTTSFFGGRYDPPHDEDALVAELAKVEPSNAIPSDVQVPEVLAARTLGARLPTFYSKHFPNPRPCGDGSRDRINVALSPRTLRVAGREVLRLPTDPNTGLAPLRSSGRHILPLMEAMNFEARVLELGGGRPDCANLYIDESTPYARALELVKSVDLPVYLVVRTRTTGTGFVQVTLGDRSRSEFAIPVTLRGAEVRLEIEHPTCSRIAPKDGHVDQEALAGCLGQIPASMTDAMTLYAQGTPAFDDVVAVLAALDVVADNIAPQWNACGDRRDCVGQSFTGNPDGPGVTSYGGDLVRLPP